MFFRKVVLALRFFFGGVLGCLRSGHRSACAGGTTNDALSLRFFSLVVVFWFFRLSVPEISRPEFAFSVR